jgi:hypothetical protein
MGDTVESNAIAESRTPSAMISALIRCAESPARRHPWCPNSYTQPHAPPNAARARAFVKRGDNGSRDRRGPASRSGAGCFRRRTRRDAVTSARSWDSRSLATPWNTAGTRLLWRRYSNGNHRNTATSSPQWAATGTLDNERTCRTIRRRAHRPARSPPPARRPLRPHLRLAGAHRETNTVAARQADAHRIGNSAMR